MKHLKKFNENNIENGFEDFLSDDFLDNLPFEAVIHKKYYKNLGSFVVQIFNSKYVDFKKDPLGIIISSGWKSNIQHALERTNEIKNPELLSGLHRFEKYSGYKIYGLSTYYICENRYRAHERQEIGYEIAFNTNELPSPY